MATQADVESLEDVQTRLSLVIVKMKETLAEPETSMRGTVGPVVHKKELEVLANALIEIAEKIR